MEGFEAENAQAIVGDRDKVPEATSFVKVKVECVTPGQQIPGTTTGYLAGSGPAVVTVSPKNVRQMQDDVEDARLIELARDQFERDIDAELAERFGNELGKYAKRNGEFTAEDAFDARYRYAAAPGSAGEGDVKIHELRSKVYETTGKSWQARFQSDQHRPVRRYLSVEVLDDAVAHPENARRERYATEQAALSGKMIAEAMAKAGIVQAAKAEGKRSSAS